MNISSRKIIYLNKHIINHKINVPRKKICREIITDILFTQPRVLSNAKTTYRVLLFKFNFAMVFFPYLLNHNKVQILKQLSINCSTMKV